MKNLIQLMVRELKMLSGNGVLMAVFIGAPIFFGILLGFVYKDAKVSDLPILVVDYDRTYLSSNLIDALNDNQYLEISQVLHDQAELKSLMQQGIQNAVITIPDGFEGDIHQKRYPEISVDLNAANILTANYAARGIQHVLETSKAGIEINSLNKQGIPVNIAQKQFESFKINMNRFFNPGANYLEFLWPGILAAILQQVFLLAMALTFSREFEKNTFNELSAKAGNAFNMLMVKSIPYWLIGMLIWGFILQFVFPYFRLSFFGVDFMALFILSALFVLSVTFIGTLVSVLIPSQLKSTEVLMIVASPSFILSGFTWPLTQMPDWVQLLAKMIPLTPFLQGFRQVFMLEGNLSTIQGSLINLGWIASISFIITISILKLKMKKIQQSTVN